MSGMKRILILSIILSLSTALFAQEEMHKDEWKRIQMVGLAYNYSSKVLEETIGDDKIDLKYGIHSLGINYCSFSGDRLGFVTDATLLIPVSTKYESESAEPNGGFTLDYMGSIGWRLVVSPFTLIPYLGFHADYGYLSKDPVDDDKSNHMISLGFGTGIRAVYDISEGKGIYLGLRGIFDSVEFTTADYDSREIQLKRKFSVMLSSGYSWRPR